MRALVIGASGQIGGWLVQALGRRGHEATGTYRTVPVAGLVRFDGRDSGEASTLLDAIRPDVVFYPAGFGYLDGCEREPDRAREFNVAQPLAMARSSADRGARFVYYSSDYVFSGERCPNSEDDPTGPLNVYGRSKVDAETGLLAALGDRSLVIRTSWVFGPERQGKNFAYQVVARLGRGETITVPADLVSNPTYAPDLAEASVRLAELGISGVIHAAGPEVMDRPAFAREIAAGFGLDPDLVESRAMTDLGFETPRPSRSGLATDRLESLLPGLLRPLSAAVADFRSELDESGPWLDPRPT